MTTIAERQAEAMRKILDGFRTELHTAMPGTVKSYDASTQRADVQPGLRRVIPALDDEEDDTAESLPVIPSVPVAWPRSGNFFLHAPLSAGDGVLLVFCEADINAWLEGSADSNPSLPERHGLTGAVAIPGLFPGADPIGSASGSYMRIGADGDEQIEFRGPTIHAGGNSPVAMADAIAAHLTAIEAALNAVAGGGANSYVKATIDSAPGGAIPSAVLRSENAN